MQLLPLFLWHHSSHYHLFSLSLSLSLLQSIPFFLDVPTLSIHFIFPQFSVPFRLFFACCSSRFHQVFWGRWKGGIQSGGHRWHISTTSCASDGHESFDLHNEWAFFWGIPVRHSNATSHQCNECRRQRSMHGNHNWGCHMLSVHTQHLHGVQYILSPCDFNPWHTYMCHQLKLRVTLLSVWGVFTSTWPCVDFWTPASKFLPVSGEFPYV